MAKQSKNPSPWVEGSGDGCTGVLDYGYGQACINHDEAMWWGGVEDKLVAGWWGGGVEDKLVAEWSVIRRHVRPEGER